jgi:hypothetical protein
MMKILRFTKVFNVWIEDIVALESGEVNYLGLGLGVFKKNSIEIKSHNG